MAEIKKNVTTLGQRITGLQAGNQYVFILKKPNLRPDVTNAHHATRIAHEQVVAHHKAITVLKQAREEAKRGDIEAAQRLLNEAKQAHGQVLRGIMDAKDFAQRALDDAKDVHKDVKSAYDAAKDSAEHAVKFAEKVAEGFPNAVKALGAMLQEAMTRK